MHKRAKRLGSFCYGNMCKSQIAHDLQSALAEGLEDSTSDEFVLLKPTCELRELSYLFSQVGVAATLVGSNAIMTGHGAFYKGRLQELGLQLIV